MSGFLTSGVYDSYGSVKDEVLACEKLVWASPPFVTGAASRDTSSENGSEKRVNISSSLSNAITLRL